MSNTFEMICKDCKEAYWFGQASSGGKTMYKPDQFMDWLVKHSICGEIAISNKYADNYPEWYNYEEFKTASYDGDQDAPN